MSGRPKWKTLPRGAQMRPGRRVQEWGGQKLETPRVEKDKARSLGVTGGEWSGQVHPSGGWLTLSPAQCGEQGAADPVAGALWLKGEPTLT